MNPDDARTQIAEAQQALRDSARPTLPVPLALAAALVAAAAVALLGVPAGGVTKLLATAGGIGLLALAFLIPTRHRRRAGVFGFTGTVARDNTVFLLTGVVLVVTGLNANSAQAIIHAGIGVIVGVLYFTLLRGLWGRPA